MGFRCPKCRQDFGADKSAFEKHLDDEGISYDYASLAAANLADITGPIFLSATVAADKSIQEK